jgi:hypothetical protein
MGRPVAWGEPDVGWDGEVMVVVLSREECEEVVIYSL